MKNYPDNFKGYISTLLVVAVFILAQTGTLYAGKGRHNPPPPPPPGPPSPPSPPGPPAPPPPPKKFHPYGFAIPGDPLYSYTYEDNASKDFLGLAAKGNIVIGDYTNKDFQDNAIPLINGDAITSISQDYVVDMTDASLGYHDYVDVNGRPHFSGNYDRVDGGTKLDDSPRKFYESSVPDDLFPLLVDSNLQSYSSGDINVDGVLFTNHALVGYVPIKNFTMNGAIISRDEAIVFDKYFRINHDTRLLNSGNGVGLALPFTLDKPQLESWREVQDTGTGGSAPVPDP